MKKSIILDYLNSILPFDKIASGDNVGELIKGKDEINSILVSLDLSASLFNFISDKKVDMIITHHPVIYNPLYKIEDDLILESIRRNISVVSLHTNYDGLVLNDIFADKCLIKVYENIFYENGIYLGRKGQIDKISFTDYIDKLKENFSLDKIKISGHIPKYVESGAVVTGSSNSFFEEIRDLDVDVFITGEFKYDNAKYFDSKRPLIIELGHYESEAIFIDHLTNHLKEVFPDIDVISFEKRISKYI